MKRNRKSKIISTIGPSTCNKKTIKELFISGADIFRLNFSHGSIEDHRKTYDLIREVEKELARPICVIADLQGPKLRIGEFADGSAELEIGATMRLDLNTEPGDARRVSLPHPEVFAALSIGTELLAHPSFGAFVRPHVPA